MDENKSAVQAILEAIEIIVERKIKSANFEVRKYGQIMKVLGNDIYGVRIQGTEFTIPCITDQAFSVGDTVLVLRPQNGVSNSVIIGKIKTR